MFTYGACTFSYFYRRSYYFVVCYGVGMVWLIQKYIYISLEMLDKKVDHLIDLYYHLTSNTFQPLPARLAAIFTRSCDMVAFTWYLAAPATFVLAVWAIQPSVTLCKQNKYDLKRKVENGTWFYFELQLKKSYFI